MSVTFRLQVAAIVAGCLLALPLSATAATIQLEFSALGFTGGPQDPVSGAIVYEAPYRREPFGADGRSIANQGFSTRLRSERGDRVRRFHLLFTERPRNLERHKCLDQPEFRP
jgi:hypothetical protein